MADLPASLTDEQFDTLSWHDVQIYAVAFSPDTYEVLLDIDYILEWRPPADGEEYFRFLVAPATLVFVNVTNVRIDVDSQGGVLSIDELSRGDPRTTPSGLTEYEWRVEAHEGSLRFRATGFRQHLRQAPQWADGQSLSMTARGGISFARPNEPPSS